MNINHILRRTLHLAPCESMRAGSTSVNEDKGDEQWPWPWPGQSPIQSTMIRSST